MKLNPLLSNSVTLSCHRFAVSSTSHFAYTWLDKVTYRIITLPACHVSSAIHDIQLNISAVEFNLFLWKRHLSCASFFSIPGPNQSWTATVISMWVDVSVNGVTWNSRLAGLQETWCDFNWSVYYQLRQPSFFFPSPCQKTVVCFHQNRSFVGQMRKWAREENWTTAAHSNGWWRPGGRLPLKAIIFPSRLRSGEWWLLENLQQAIRFMSDLKAWCAFRVFSQKKRKASGILVKRALVWRLGDEAEKAQWDTVEKCPHPSAWGHFSLPCRTL